MSINYTAAEGGTSEILPMETLKRTELLYFIINLCDKNGWNRPHMIQTPALKIPKTTEESVTLRIESKASRDPQSSASAKLLSTLIASNFINALMVSHLDRYRGKKLFSRREWKQSLCVLTNIGILQFDEVDDKKPSSLIPVCNSDLRELPQSAY
jgi:hypothetical protein